ncbi:MAM and LDL-receptor class A domain-containing protein 1-like isoform X2 [Montipora foliosa]|uniref:MAM and LDL-receptor class A domain-containing protein 1-like isoform X2 n=2 Tax=Montipora TaxID=46703 RepID=UPI0035F16E47
MEVLLATLVLVLVSLTYGGPIWPSSNLADDRDPSATEVIFKINQEEDVEPQLFEGDILLGPDDYGATEDGGMPREKRNARRSRRYIWKAKIIPYEISRQLIEEGYNSTILSAIEEFSNHTCIQWKPRTDEEQWVTFVKKSGCYSRVGVIYWLPGPQDISLGTGCNRKGVVMHEMMHAAGFWHEQSRYDRDEYVEILWENIRKGKEHNFHKYDLRKIDYLNEVYDTSSLMHYGKTSFSSNNKPTIQVIGDPNKQLGQRDGFSKTDIAQLNALYDCSGPSGGWSSWSSFGPCNDKCEHNRQRFCSSRDLNNCSQADRYGIQTDVQNCSNEKCYAPVDGQWGRWSSWSSCSVTCDQGVRNRTRICDDPAPKNGGKDCQGNSSEVRGCRQKRCGLGPSDCEFEAGGMCHWTFCNQSNCCPYWIRNTGATSSLSTGPQGDHTSDSGYYLYFEASLPAQPGNTSCFSSKVFPAGCCQNLTFWYHMLGSGIGELRVIVNGSVVWRKSGEQGDKWIQASVEIQSDQEFQVTFEGVRGPDYRGDIAVDDIFFKDCEAPKLPCKFPVDGHWSRWSSWSSCSVTCDQGVQNRTRICDDPAPKNGGKDCQGNSSEVRGCRQKRCGLGPNDCEFEAGGMCHWTFCQQSNCCPYWKLHTGNTSSPSTGPQGDHTSGLGNYLYFEASNPAEPGETSCFSSKVFPAGSCQCLTFWHHMLGGGIGELRVIVNGSVVWRKSGEQGDKWSQASVEIQSDQEFQVTFEGVRGPDFRGDIGVDDIFFNDCKAPKVPCKVPVDGHWSRWSSWSSCSVTCDHGVQNRTRICDDPAPKNGGKDCQGNSSEVRGCRQKRCGLGPNDCEFEAGGMCHWTFCNQSNCCPYWILNTGATRSLSTGPQGDHTSDSGNYLYFEASNPAKPGQTSCFSSKVFPAGSCQCLTFWYHMLGGGIGELRVIVSGSVVWRKSGEQGDKWSQAAVEIQSDQEFQVTFEGVRGPDHRGDIAVDDIFFKDCKAPKVPCKVPVDGHWSRWSSWSSCSVTCDQGVQNRTRICDDPAPKNGGKDCQGNSSEVRGCRRKRCRLGPNDCEFEARGMCHWTFCNQDNCCPYWKLHTGNTSSPSTGPQGDHTSGSGNYIYFEASDPAEPGDTSCFSSKVFPPGFCQRLIFWYHMLGSGIGELRVIVSGSVVWTKSGEQGDKWSQANIEFQSDQEFQVTFEGVRGPGYRGDIAVDDIFFEDCNAPVPTLPSKGIRHPKYWPSIIALGHLWVVFCR